MASEQPKLVNRAVESAPMVLKIEGIIQAAEKIRQRISSELPQHAGLSGAVDFIVAAANSAQKVSRQVKHPFSIHRLPAVFLAIALVLLTGWLYWYFFHVSTLSIAMANRDSTEILEKSAQTWRLRLQPKFVPGSREAIEAVASGQVDLAYVQGGMPVPEALPRLRTPADETVLWLTREGIENVDDVKTVLTSLEGEGSHTVAKEIFSILGAEENIKYLHQWSALTDGSMASVAPEVDAVFVVKDVSDLKAISALRKLYQQGFRLRDLQLGAAAENLEYLEASEIEPGYFDMEAKIPVAVVRSYRIPTFIIARAGLTPRLLAVAAHIFDSQPASIAEGEFLPTASSASEMFQGVEAFLGIIVNIILAFLALLGLEMMTYRKRFHELNSLVSLLSMLQSNKDILGVEDVALRNENLKYLSTVSDLLGLISAISGYYTQENSSLLFNNLSEVVHQRCDNLKLNIQLKILHAGIRLERLAPVMTAPLV